MVQAEMTGNPTQVFPIHIQLDRFLVYLVWVSQGFGFWGVFDLAEYAVIALAAAVRFPSSVLALRAMASWTCNRASILA